MNLPNDPRWPRAGQWFSPADTSTSSDIGLLGIPTHLTSLSPTNAHLTPAAVREALLRFSTWSASAQLDLADHLTAIDAGDVEYPDHAMGEERAEVAVASLITSTQLALLVGGDNSMTFSSVRGLASAVGGWERVGVITLDAHHDIRDGVSNGSPIRRLIDDGLDPRHIVQIGISDFANSQEYASLVRQLGISVIHRDRIDAASIEAICAEAIEIAGAGNRFLYVDVDVDVCDRSVAPACPAAVPGGISARELRAFCRLLAQEPRVRAMDFVEVDASVDPDGRTLRLVALSILEAATGAALRPGRV